MNGLPGCVALPEGRFLAELAHRLVRTRLSRSDVRTARSHIAGHWQFRAWRMPLPMEDRPFDPATLRGFTGNFVHAFARMQGRSEAGLRYFVDQFPDNILYLPDLLRHFPTARFVHLIRDGRATAASVKPLDWGPNTALRAAHWWTRYLAAGEALRAAVPPANLCELRYERLVAEEEAVAAELRRFLGLAEHALDTDRPFVLPGYTRSQHALVRGPADRSRITAWRTQLGAREIRIFEGIAGDELLRLGYELVTPGERRPPGLVEQVALLAYDCLKKQRNGIIYRRRRAIGLQGPGTAP